MVDGGGGGGGIREGVSDGCNVYEAELTLIGRLPAHTDNDVTSHLLLDNITLQIKQTLTAYYPHVNLTGYNLLNKTYSILGHHID